MYILVGADLVPTKSNESLFCMGDAEALVGEELLYMLKQSDANIFNLETPLTNAKTPISKCGPNLSADPQTAIGFKSLFISHVTLANNHIMDQDANGLYDTINCLNEVNIQYTGVITKFEKNISPMIIELCGKKIGIYACAEHEFSISNNNNIGAIPYDPLTSFDHIRKMEKECDYNIVLYHGGREQYRYPSPELMRRCRYFVESGADLVLCQHSHCIGCEENYKGSTIIYGQGNFIFDDNEDECWQSGMIIKIDENYDLQRIWIQKQKNAIRIANPSLAQSISRDYYKRSEQIKDIDFVNNHYREYAISSLETLLSTAHGRRWLISKVINKLTKGKWSKYYYKMIYGKKQKNELLNRIECEAWHELFVCALSGEKE